MNRRAFLKSVKTPGSPLSVASTRTVLSGTAPYAGEWTANEVAHLLKRTMFGATRQDVEYFLTMTPGEAVDELLTDASAVSPPVRDYGLIETLNGTYDDAGVAMGATWINDFTPIADPNVRGPINALRIESLHKWWAGLIINQNRTIFEKMVLFWHHHFSVQKEEVEQHIPLYRHHDLLRRNALGNVRQLTKDVTTDPAMLFHLNGYLNSKLAPDENYARELQELFTVGKGPDSLYTEDDVIAAARVLTGWRVNSDTFEAFLEPAMHDTGPKTFSAFYNNTTITGSADALDELDRFINMIFATNECAKFFCRKLYRFFVNSNIDDSVETSVISPLASILRDNNYEIKPVLAALFKSEHFFDPVNRACYIKSPLDFIIGAMREFNVPFPSYTDYAAGYPLFNNLYSRAAEMQQNLFQPPDVSGWPAYHQEPMFYELWINSNSLPRRAKFTDNMIDEGIVNVRTFAANTSNPSDPDQLITDVVNLILRYPLSDNSKTYIKNTFLVNNTGDNNVWTNAWTSNNNAVINSSLANMFKFITNLPEYHLC
ncbi:MAG: DUF1800 domain-containing protein [Chitinophagaceae bacterium]|nr:DUF1800 domain-containing protein [Chitinophagaceae bacterium]